MSRSSISGAPGHLSTAINKYSDHDSSWIRRDTKYDLKADMYQMSRADVVHWHNTIDLDVYHKFDKKTHILQYHSPPDNLHIWEQRGKIPSDVRQLVIPHYHAGLRAYENCTTARNIVDLSSYTLDNTPTERVSISFSPSSNEYGTWQRKGVEQHGSVFNLLVEHYRGSIMVDTIKEVDYHECLTRKARADIVVDECVTPSYHLSSLEGLALGKPTICWIDSRVQEILATCSGSDTLPFHSVYVGWLQDYLVDMIDRGRDYLIEEGRKSKQWFETFWRPVDIVSEYINIYNES